MALLRGINVGGRNLISMADLRDAFAAEGYRNARTYVQSGNVVFESDSAQGRPKTTRGATKTRLFILGPCARISLRRTPWQPGGGNSGNSELSLANFRVFLRAQPGGFGPPSRINCAPEGGRSEAVDAYRLSDPILIIGSNIERTDPDMPHFTAGNSDATDPLKFSPIDTPDHYVAMPRAAPFGTPSSMQKRHTISQQIIAGKDPCDTLVPFRRHSSDHLATSNIHLRYTLGKVHSAEHLSERQEPPITRIERV